MIGKVNIGALLTVDEVKSIDTAAFRLGTKRADLIRRALREFLERHALQDHELAMSVAP